ncbi:MAG TPA: Gfo/Idh/MocA family oxidoreductase, partial [Chitinophagales bacterium]|nr:Gfo/Idh/MocA family oxidoreductase [Chitinophagales bacterium]
GKSHIEAVRRIGLCELYAVADTNEALARARAQEFGIEKIYSNVDEMIANPEIDVIHNCTPNFLHSVINEKIIRAGKHLLTEKPLCCTSAEADSLISLAKRYPDTVICVNYHYRMNPMVQEMKWRVARGDAGDIRVITGSYQQDYLLYDTDYSWRLDPTVAGCSCAIADIGSHWMDAVQFVTGHKIIEIYADLVTIVPVRKKPALQSETFKSQAADKFEIKKIENEDYGAVLFRMDNGACGVYHVSEVAAGHGCYFNFELNGTQCSMRWNQEENDHMWIGRRDGDNSLIIRNPNTMAPEVRKYTSLAMGHPEGWNDAFKENIAAFYRFISEGKRLYSDIPDFCTLEDAGYLIKLIEASVRSSREKKWVSI